MRNFSWENFKVVKWLDKIFVLAVLFFLHFFKQSFASEVEDIFKNSIFTQIFFSCIIICMTLLLLADQPGNISVIISKLSYLLTMVIQILLFCWIGNEIIYSVSMTDFLLNSS